MKAVIVFTNSCMGCPKRRRWQDMGASGLYCDLIGFDNGRIEHEDDNSKFIMPNCPLTNITPEYMRQLIKIAKQEPL